MDKKLKLIVIVFFVCIFAYLFVSREIERRQIASKPVFAIATIGKFDHISKRSSNSINYSFEVNGVNYEGSQVYDIYISNAGEFIGKKFKVVYDKENIKNNQLLLTREDYNQFRLNYPDSLKWVDSFIFK